MEGRERGEALKEGRGWGAENFWRDGIKKIEDGKVRQGSEREGRREGSEKVEPKKGDGGEKRLFEEME